MCLHHFVTQVLKLVLYSLHSDYTNDLWVVNVSETTRLLVHVSVFNSVYTIAFKPQNLDNLKIKLEKKKTNTMSYE